MDWLNPLTTLVASFSGAWAAFLLQRVERSKDVENAHVAAANTVLLTLMQQANELRMYEREHIDPHREHPGRHVVMEAVHPFAENDLKHDLASLSYLNGKEERGVVFQLSVNERKYIDAMRVINHRSRLLTEKAHPALIAAGAQPDAVLSSIQFHQILGNVLMNQLEQSTDDVVLHVSSTISAILESKDKLRACVLNRYPRADLYNFSVADQAPAP